MILYIYNIKIYLSLINNMTSLIIVESPAKAVKIQKMLNGKYVVKSSFGHLRNLKGKNKGVDVKNNFAPIFEITKKKQYNSLKKAIKASSKVILAMDEDREGEGIAWHIADLFKLNIKTTDRIVFHEITKSAILKALSNPRKIDMALVKAQQYRQILDYLVGFELSPVLWNNVQSNTSAGRVQSVACNLVHEREKMIKDFKHSFYYKSNGNFGKIKSLLSAKFKKTEQVKEFLTDCKTAVFKILNISNKKFNKLPPKPFITSSIQIECNKRFKISPKNIMSILQKLYENGHITYHRTDSTIICKEVRDKITKMILDKYGNKYIGKSSGKSGKVKGAQEAHEAIRPTKISLINLPNNCSDFEKKLYSIIWKRTIASFMSPMIYNKYILKINISNRKELFVANSNKTIFDGYTIIYKELINPDKEKLPENLGDFSEYKLGEQIKYKTIISTQSLTSSKKRYTEATLIKQMEKLGVGRPSTYASIINKIIDRKYTVIKNVKGKEIKTDIYTLSKNSIKLSNKNTISGKENRAMCITELGTRVDKYLITMFSNIINHKFTSQIEDGLDKIAHGSFKNNDTFVKTVYDMFHPTVEKLMSKSNLKGKQNNILKQMSKRLVGKHSSGKNVYSYEAKFGPVVQLGEDDDPNKKYSGVSDWEKITIDEATQLLMYPKILGKYKGEDVLIKKGKYGYYINWNDANYKISGDFDEKLSLKDAAECIMVKKSENIQSFKNGKMIVRKGKYGPYILYNSKFTKIPTGVNPEEITERQCDALVNGKSSF
jgi:DNA topoisomerase-1